MPDQPSPPPPAKPTAPDTLAALPISRAVILPRTDGDKLRQLYSTEQLTAFVDHEQARTKYKICGYVALEADGVTPRVCKKAAGAGTVHKGQGHCHKHEIAHGVHLKHGLFSDYLQQCPSLQAVFEQQLADAAEVHGLAEEIGVARTVLSDRLEQLKEVDLSNTQQAAEHAAKLSQVLASLETIRKLAESHAAITDRAKAGVTYDVFASVLWQLQRICDEEIGDADLKARLFQRFSLEVHVAGTAVPR